MHIASATSSLKSGYLQVVSALVAIYLLCLTIIFLTATTKYHLSWFGFMLLSVFTCLYFLLFHGIRSAFAAWLLHLAIGIFILGYLTEFADKNIWSARDNEHYDGAEFAPVFTLIRLLPLLLVVEWAVTRPVIKWGSALMLGATATYLLALILFSDPFSLHSSPFRIAFELNCVLLASAIFIILCWVPSVRDWLNQVGRFRGNARQGVADYGFNILCLTLATAFAIIIAVQTYWSNQMVLSGENRRLNVFATNLYENFIDTHSEASRFISNHMPPDNNDANPNTKSSREYNLRINNELPHVLAVTRGPDYSDTKTIYLRRNGKPKAISSQTMEFRKLSAGDGKTELSIAFLDTSSISATKINAYDNIYVEIDYPHQVDFGGLDWMIFDKEPERVLFQSYRSSVIDPSSYVQYDQYSRSRHRFKHPFITEAVRHDEFGLRYNLDLGEPPDLKLSVFTNLEHQTLASAVLANKLAWLYVLMLFVVLATAGLVLYRYHIWWSRYLAFLEKWIVESRPPTHLDLSILEISQLHEKIEALIFDRTRELDVNRRLASRLAAEHAELESIQSAAPKLILVVLSTAGDVVNTNFRARSELRARVGANVGLLAASSPSNHYGELWKGMHRVFLQAKERLGHVEDQLVVGGDDTETSYWMCGVTPYKSGDPESHQQRTRYVVWLSDVTDTVFTRVQAEHNRRLAFLGETVAGMAHEISQPLNTIRLAAQNIQVLLNDPEADKDAIQKKIERIDGQVTRACRLISTLRSHSRRGEVEKKLRDLDMMIRDSLELLEPQLALDEIVVEYTPPDDGLKIVSDNTLFEQIVTNIVLNARDAILSDPNRIVPAIISIETMAKYDSVHVLIGNHGPDIPAPILAKIFNPFFSTKARSSASGMGLGLSLCVSLMSQIHGEIDVVSKQGKTTFVLVFPNLDTSLRYSEERSV